MLAAKHDQIFRLLIAQILVADMVNVQPARFGKAHRAPIMPMFQCAAANFGPVIRLEIFQVRHLPKRRRHEQPSAIFQKR